MKNIVKISLLAAAIVAAPTLSRAQDMTNQAPAVAPAAPAVAPAAPAAAPDQTTPAPVKPKKKQGLVFRGTISAIDTNAMTLTVEARTFNITSETRIMNDGKPATLSDGVVGEPVSGAYKKGDGDALNATSVRFGAKAGGKKKKEADAPAAPAVAPAN